MFCQGFLIFIFGVVILFSVNMIFLEDLMSQFSDGDCIHFPQAKNGLPQHTLAKRISGEFENVGDADL